MDVETSVDIDINLQCINCGEYLEYNGKSDGYNCVDLRVQPCKECNDSDKEEEMEVTK